MEIINQTQPLNYKKVKTLGFSNGLAYAWPGIARYLCSVRRSCRVGVFRSTHQIKSNQLAAHQIDYSFFSYGATFHKLYKVNNLVPLWVQFEYAEYLYTRLSGVSSGLKNYKSRK